MDAIEKKLEYIYGRESAAKTARRLGSLIARAQRKMPKFSGAESGGIPADQTDAVMITYGDNLQQTGKAPLAVLQAFADDRLAGMVSGIHILPFSPYSSDDGFSVMDYRQVNPSWGDWSHISGIAKKFRLMADLVLNHCSAQGTWFQRFLMDEKPYSDYFITVEPGTDLSTVFRPRALPLTHEFDVGGRPTQVWTTFSGDQVDLNFANPDVLLEFADILLDYVAKGVRMIRLDAVGFLWKEIGTSCMHHPKTHEMIKLFRLILRRAAPGVILITETNVPHKENISYFGSGTDEAHMVYQFTLPPLTLDAYLRGDASKLTEWASGLPAPSPDCTFFNFLASHDGIGVLPARGYLGEEEMSSLIEAVKLRGGLISYKSTPSGEIPYELNISYRDAIAEKELPPELRARKFLSSQAVMLAMAGVPGIYIHSLLGSGNWPEGVDVTGANRTINREKLNVEKLNAELNDPNGIRSRIFTGWKAMLAARRAHPAFHPAAGQRILNLGPGLFALERRAMEGSSVLCLQSVSSNRLQVGPPAPWSESPVLRDLISGRRLETAAGAVSLEPWEVLWLEASA